MVMRVCDGVFVGLVPYLDQQVDQQDRLLGLLLHRGLFGFYLLVAKQVGDGLYERAGLIMFGSGTVHMVDGEPILFLDEDGCVLDEVSVNLEHFLYDNFFANNFVRRDICLV